MNERKGAWMTEGKAKRTMNPIRKYEMKDLNERGKEVMNGGEKNRGEK